MHIDIDLINFTHYSLTGELLCVFSGDFGENCSRYNGNALCQESFTRFVVTWYD